MTDTQQRFEGCLLGLACGDAVGGPVEFYRRGRFPPVQGMHGGGKFELRPGEWTDDTAMALCLAESLLARKGIDPLDQMQRYWRWADQGHHSTRHHAFGLGKTVANALMRFRRTGDPLAGTADPATAGNGSLMRLAPVAMFCFNDRQAMLEAAELTSRTTHAAEEALAACRYLAAILHAALHGAPDKASLLSAADDIPLPSGMTRIARKEFLTAPMDRIYGRGYVVDCLEAALWCFWHSDSFEEAILRSANLGDDADSTAAVCGQIAGAFHGVSAIPEEWRHTLFRYDAIRDFAGALFRQRLPRTTHTNG